jgi:hypothetical protein
VSLPREQNEARDAQQENVIVTVDARQAAIYWFDTKLPDAKRRWAELLAKIAAMQPQPELHIRGDVRADYESVGQRGAGRAAGGHRAHRLPHRCRRAATHRCTSAPAPNFAADPEPG